MNKLLYTGDNSRTATLLNQLLNFCRSKLNQRIVLSLCLYCISFYSAASITTAQTPGGNWNGAGVWTNGIPGCFDTIVIPVGVTVTVNNQYDLSACPPIVVIVYGTLTFQTGKKLILPADSEVQIETGGTVQPAGGGGNSNFIEIGTEIVWSAADGTLTGPLVLTTNFDPLSVNLEYISCTLEDREVLIKWRTIAEEMNDFFRIEKMEDQFSNWYSISVIDGHGTTSSVHNYSSIDVLSSPGRYYYRVYQIDFDGKETLLGEFLIEKNSELKVLHEYNLLGQTATENNSGIIIQILEDGSTRKVYK